MACIQIRLAEDSDNDRIIELGKRCPQQGMITLLPIRTPRFNSIHKLFDPEAWHMVASTGDRIIGLVGVINYKARIDDKEIKLGYMLDFKVDQEFRNGLTTYRLVKAAVDHLKESDTDMVLVNFLKGNNRSLIFASGKGGLPAAIPLGDNRIFNMIPLRTMKPEPQYIIEAPTSGDIPELLDLYRSYGSGFKLSPVITEEIFNRYLESVNGLSLDNFLVARKNGEIKAVTALWDDSTYKTYEVKDLNVTIKAFSGFLKFLSLFRKAPPPVSANKPLKQLLLALYAHDNCPGALSTLFRHINNISLGSDYNVITLYAQSHDPIFLHMKKFVGLTIISEMYLFSKDLALAEKLAKNGSAVLPGLATLI